MYPVFRGKPIGRTIMVRNLRTIFLLFTSVCLTIVIYRLFLLSNAALLVQNVSVPNVKNCPTVSQSRCPLPSKTSDSAVSIDRNLFDYMAFYLRDTPYKGVGFYIRFMRAKLGLQPLTHIEPLEPGMVGPIINDVASFQYPISIAPCRQTKNRSLFVAVISAPDHFEKRNLIRQTWPKHFKNQSNAKILDVAGFAFVIGLTNDTDIHQKIAEESETYGDILQISVQDNYRNLSMKVGGLLNWVNTYCSQVDFMLKVDDDVYVNVHNLATILYSLSPSDRSIYGHSVGGGHPERIEGKWPTSYENWPWYEMPKFFQGAGIVISGSAIRPLLAAIQTTPYFIWDDVYLTGLCAVKARVTVRSCKHGFFVTGGPHKIPEPCFARNTVLWQTRSAEFMNQSHIITHKLYRDADGPCIISGIIANPNSSMIVVGSSIIYNAATASEFPFTSIMQI